MKYIDKLFAGLALVPFLLMIALTEVQAQSLRVGYYGETLTHYGLKVAYELPLRSYIKEKNRAQKAFLFAPGLAAYRHPRNHVGLVLSPELATAGRAGAGGYSTLGVRFSESWHEPFITETAKFNQAVLDFVQ